MALLDRAQFAAEFAAETTSISAARQFVRDGMHGVLADRIDDVLLATSELATNAVEHGSGQNFSVTVERAADEIGVRVESIAPSEMVDTPGFGPLTSGLSNRSGRGLGIVAAVADASGMEIVHGRLCAWFRFSVVAPAR